MVQVWENYKIKLSGKDIFIVLDRQRYDYLTEKEIPLLKRMKSVYYEAKTVAIDHGVSKPKVEKIWYGGVWYHLICTDDICSLNNLN